MARLRTAPEHRIATAVEHGGYASDVTRALAARGISTDAIDIGSASDVSPQVGAVAFAPQEPLTPERAAEIVDMCARAAEAGRPVVTLHAFPVAKGNESLRRAAAVGYLRAFGAIVCTDPDVWLETLVLFAAFSAPRGPHTAIIAPPGTWLAASAAALEAEAIAIGSRFMPIAHDADAVTPADVVLCDRAALSAATSARVAASVLPVLGRAELAEGRPTLVGLRAALGAVKGAGRYSQRVKAGLGPDPTSFEQDVDHDRFDRQLSKLGRRAGDHETKVLLASYGVEVTRQAVATTQSAATRIAKKAGLPVELKPWGPDCPTELEGCPVERNLHTAADIRRAFATVSGALDRPIGSPVIVRASPPQGRELRARFVRVGAVGWSVVVDIAGIATPIAAAAPLRAIDAHELARHLEASRVSDAEPDREAVAELLRRASHMVAACDRIVSLDLVRIIAASRGEQVLVVDAAAELAD